MLIFLFLEELCLLTCYFHVCWHYNITPHQLVTFFTMFDQHTVYMWGGCSLNCELLMQNSYEHNILMTKVTSIFKAIMIWDSKRKYKNLHFGSSSVPSRQSGNPFVIPSNPTQCSSPHVNWWCSQLAED